MRSMRYLFVVPIIAVLSGSVALADQSRPAKQDFSTPLDALPPAKVTTGRPCAAFGPGFVKVDGSDTCVKAGGALRINGGAAR